MTVQFIKVAGVFVRVSMMDAISVVGFGAMDALVLALIGPFILTAVTLIAFGCTVRT